MSNAGVIFVKVGEEWVRVDTIKGEPFRFEDFTQEQLDSITAGLGDYLYTTILGGSS